MSDILPPGWLTREQAQELTGYSENHLTRLARGGQVTAQKLAGQVWLFERESLLAHQAAARPGRKRKARQEAAEDARDNREIDALEADIKSGAAQLRDHADVWAEIEKLEAEETEE